MDGKRSVDYKALVRLCMKSKKKNRVLNQEQLDDLRLSLQRQCDGEKIDEDEWISAVRWLTKKGIIRVKNLSITPESSKIWRSIKDQTLLTKKIFECCPACEGFC